MKKSSLFIICLVLIISACDGGSDGEESVASGPLPQIFIFPGEAEKRLISQETIEQNNCDGTAEMSQEVGRSHTVLYTLELGSGIKVEADGRAKIPEIGEVGVGVEVAANYQVGYGRSETVSRAQTVAAAPNSHIQHTIQQFEIWETGEVLIVVGEINQRLPYSFRRDFSIDTVAPANIGCPGGTVVEPLDPISEPEPASDSQTISCAAILYENLEDLRKISSVSEALSQAEDFANHRQNDYREGDTIPSNVLIATDLQSANLSQFPVTPINNQGGWGLFLTTSGFTAPNDGTYWCLDEGTDAVNGNTGDSTSNTRSAKLSLYDSIYSQQGWCSVWNQMMSDGLVSGSCPQTVNTTVKEDIVMDNGSTSNLITGVQITINSQILVNYPACINYGIDGDYATVTGGRTQSWTSNSNIATDVTVEPNSIFSLYFRCDHIAWR